jgi:hypothetical protein
MNAGTAQQYARWIGFLYLVSLVAGGWGESHVPNTLLIANDLAGTARQMASSTGIFRSSFAAYLIEAASDITLNVLLHALLRPVSRNLALLAMCFGLIGTAIFAAGEMLYFARCATGGGCRCRPRHFAGGQGNAHHLCLTIYGYGFGIFAIFYGIAAVVLGYLISCSGYLPRALGVIVILGGASFIAENFLIVLAPQYHLPYIIAPMILAMASLMLWPLIKGVDLAQWDARLAARTVAEK